MSSTCVDTSDSHLWQTEGHPEIPSEVLEEWQHIITLMARILNAPAGLIMRLEEDHLSVSIRSETENNPYNVGDSEAWLDSGLYCETVIRSRDRLFVANALESDAWKNNPDVKLNMINYLGFPIYWPGGDPFGTICVLDNRTHHYSIDEEELIVRFKKAVEKSLILTEKTIQLENLNRELEWLSSRDSLTNIYNRRSFFELSEKALNQGRRRKRTTSLLVLDLDRFKMINDSYGHHAGDDVLKEFADTVAKMVRSEDIFGRLGGEEFAILIPEIGREGALLFAERLRREVSMLSFPTDKGTASITVSIGVSECEYSNRDLQQLLDEADIALYRSKDAGRDRVTLYQLP
jgi:diguanylate cyclase (GGDEF)-like protein